MTGDRADYAVITALLLERYRVKSEGTIDTWRLGRQGYFLSFFVDFRGRLILPNALDLDLLLRAIGDDEAVKHVVAILLTGHIARLGAFIPEPLAHYTLKLLARAFSGAEL